MRKKYRVAEWRERERVRGLKRNHRVEVGFCYAYNPFSNPTKSLIVRNLSKFMNFLIPIGLHGLYKNLLKS